MFAIEEQVQFFKRYKNSSLLAKLESEYFSFLLDFLGDGKVKNADFFQTLKYIDDTPFKKFIVKLIITQMEKLMFSSNTQLMKISTHWRDSFKFVCEKINEVQQCEGDVKINHVVVAPSSDSLAYGLLLLLKESLKESDYTNLDVVPSFKLVNNVLGFNILEKHKEIVNGYVLSQFLEPDNKKLIKEYEDIVEYYLAQNFIGNPLKFLVKTKTVHNFSGEDLIASYLRRCGQNNIEVIATIENIMAEYLQSNKSGYIDIFDFKEKILPVLLELNIMDDKTIFDLFFLSYIEEVGDDKEFIWDGDVKNRASQAYNQLKEILNKKLFENFKIGKFEDCGSNQIISSSKVLKLIEEGLKDTIIGCERTIDSKHKYTFKIKDGEVLNDEDKEIWNELKRVLKWDYIDVNIIGEQISSIVQKIRMKNDILEISKNTKKTPKKF